MLFLPFIIVLHFLYFFRERFLPFKPLSSISQTTKVPRYVLVSGCDTGFGNLLAKELDKQGWYTIAMCLNESSAKKLSSESSSNLSTIVCDIADEGSVARAFEEVIKITSDNGKRKPSLYGLVNNAGIGQGARFDWTPLSVYQRVMSVNFIGHVNVSKNAQPLLLEYAVSHQCKFGSSRIVNITSMAGLSATAGMSAYCASKFAFEGFTDAVRKEQKPFGISISTVNPAFMSTEIVKNAKPAYELVWGNTSPEVKKIYGDQYFETMVKAVGGLESVSESPMKCIHSILHALQSPSPYARYLPGWQAKILFLVSYLPSFIGDPLLAKMERCVPAIVLEAQAGKKDS